MVTFRTEEGLPFVPLRYINKIIWSAIARAYELYPIEVCAFTFESNHAHMLLRVTDPEAVPLFIGYIKQETAHALNRLIGRRQKTIWVDGYDSPTILDSHTALNKLAYVLLNPVKDQLVSDMNQYPGVSTYRLLYEEKDTVTVERIFRDAVNKVKNPAKPWLEEKSYQFDDERKSELEFKLHPYAWKECFADTKELSDAEAREVMLEVLKTEEEKIEKKKDLDPERLKHQSLVAEYRPKKFGKRMICLSISPKHRRKFINLYRYLVDLGLEALKSWREGKIVPFPAGLFPPCLPRTTNLITSAVWT